ncbi:TPA: hypothetical protein ACH3X2_006212 [Trebouxia sp. C0005]
MSTTATPQARTVINGDAVHHWTVLENVEGSNDPSIPCVLRKPASTIYEALAMYLKEDKDRIVQDFVTYEVNLKRKREVSRVDYATEIGAAAARGACSVAGLASFSDIHDAKFFSGLVNACTNPAQAQNNIQTLSTISQRLKDDGLALRSFTSEAADLVAKANKIADNVRQATRVVHHIVELRQRETEDARNPQGGPVEEIDILDE